jgi:hypothetical protein
MASPEPNVWHQVHAQREDGVAAMFLIRDIEPRADQPKIFVVELPYAVTDLSGQPDAAGYRRLGAFQEQWLEPACAALGWTFVAWKSEDGSFFLYLYGDGDPDALLEKLAPFDGELGFFNDVDAEWSEYAALRELVEQSEASGHGHGHDHDHGDHDHDDDQDDDHHHGHAGTTPGIRVIDLTGEAPKQNGTSRAASVISEAAARRSAPRSNRGAGKPATRAAASKPAARAKRAAGKPAKRAATTGKPAKRAATTGKPAKRAATTGKPAKRAAKPANRGR